ncbi:energy transducer TonB [Bradyrhizobium yuanmingense]|uniref:energy transducer TonB family protein n=1 Tax=Bradyrhizobium yuanmingense TaxID=108015 RepID=UPI0023B98466|nr:energy transducer TonB [Bradyrhizobium yuanmingense]MDF0516906.1 energy transducer TonB [Bradyrhizobium yuanmingense]
MNRSGGFVTREVRLAETALWASGAVFTVAIHAGIAAWLLRSDLVVAAADAPPTAVMIELAEAPQAAMTEMNELTPALRTVEENVAQLEQKQEEAPKDPPKDPPPEPTVEPELVEQVVREKPPHLEKVEVSLPAAAPKMEKSTQKPKPRKEHAATEAQAAIRAQAQAPQSSRTAAAQTASGASSLSPASWQSLLMGHLERHKRYPSGAQSRGEGGVAYVRFSIDERGNVLSASLARSAGSAELDREVIALVHRASPVPAPPPGARRSITAPVRFSTR